MSDLFKPVDFCGMKLRNRIVRSATMENLATADHLPSPDLLELYEQMAMGQIGLIITSSVRPDRKWDLNPQGKNLCIDRDDMIAAFKGLSRRVHAQGGHVAVQLGSFFRYKGQLAGPAANPADSSQRVLTINDINKIIEAYGVAGERCRRAGFDAVQLNAAHAFPLSQFLSPYYNTRDDEYGGNTENRCRIISDITRAIHRRAGAELPVFIKMNVMDFCKGGIVVDEAARMINIIAQNGMCAVESSCGGIGHEMNWLGPDDPNQWQEGYLRNYTADLKSKVDVPVIMVGGMRNAAMMEDVLQSGQADLISMSRPFIKEPQLIKRWMEGDLSPAECISCNGCMGLFRDNEPVVCITGS